MFIQQRRFLYLGIACTLLALPLFLSKAKKDSSLEVQTLLPLHYQFFEISSQHTQGRLQEALEKSIALQEKLSQEETPYLVLFTLYQTGVLQKKLGNTNGEKAAWEQMLAIATSPDTPLTVKKAFVHLSHTLASEGFSLREFLQHRLDLLSTGL